jgi:hypothetical protein
MHDQAAAEFGMAMAVHRWRLVYGGGRVGLMGTVARAVLAGGGEVLGVIPQGLLDRELAMTEVNELVVTQTLRQRKAIMDERADAFVALPGGFGTLEEMVETLTLRQLRYHNKPIILLNLNGFYDPLLTFFDHIITEGFASSNATELYHVADSVAAAVMLLERYAGN